MQTSSFGDSGTSDVQIADFKHYRFLTGTREEEQKSVLEMLGKVDMFNPPISLLTDIPETIQRTAADVTDPLDRAVLSVCQFPKAQRR